MERRRRDDHCLIRLLRYNLLLYKQRQTPLGASTASDATTGAPPSRSDALVAIRKDQLNHYSATLSSSSSSSTPPSSMCSPNCTISSAANLVLSRGLNAYSHLVLYSPGSRALSRVSKVYELCCQLTTQCSTDHIGISFLMEATVCTHSVAWTCTRSQGWNTTFLRAHCSNFLSNSDFHFAM